MLNGRGSITSFVKNAEPLERPETKNHGTKPWEAHDANPAKPGEGHISLPNKMIAPGVEPKLRRIRAR